MHLFGAASSYFFNPGSEVGFCRKFKNRTRSAISKYRNPKNKQLASFGFCCLWLKGKDWGPEWGSSWGHEGKLLVSIGLF